jgi:Ca2+-binding EF-hand superfamily protein
MPPGKKPTEGKGGVARKLSVGPQSSSLGAVPQGSNRGAAPQGSSRGAPASQRSAKGKPKDTAAKVKKAALANRKEGAPLTTAAIKGVFKALDTDSSGTVSVEELQATIAKTSDSVSLEEIKEAIEEFDVNGDGEISLQEFLHFMKSDAIRPTDPTTGAPLPMTLPVELRKAFEAFDTDHSGFLSKSEFAQVLKKTGAGGAALTDEEIELVVHKFDLDGDGKISLKEFQAMMEAGAAGPKHPRPPEAAAEMAARAAKFVEEAEAMEAKLKGMETLKCRVGRAIRLSGKKVEQLAHEWDENGDGSITLMEWRKSIRGNASVEASDVRELDELFKSLDTDHSGSIEINELKVAVKQCKTEESRVLALQAKGQAKVDHLREHAVEAQAAYEATKHLDELYARWVEIEIMLGKHRFKKGEKIPGSLAPRMYASMMKRGNKISELANKKDGKIDFKEFTATVTGFVPSATEEDLRELFTTLDKDGGGAIERQELADLMYVIQRKATEAAGTESSLVTAVDAAADTACELHNALAKGLAEDEEAAKAEAEAAEAQKAKDEAAAKEAIRLAVAAKKEAAKELKERADKSIAKAKENAPIDVS